MRRQYTSVLAIGIGAVAGLRPMMAYAVVALSLKRRWIPRQDSPFARIISANASKRIVELAIAELVADKLPFTRSRLNVASLATRVASGAICAAAIHSARKRTLPTGAILGGLAAIAAALAGYHVRKKMSHDLPDFAVALVEDALAAGGGIVIAALAATAD